MLDLLKRSPQPPKPPARARLIPAAMITVAAVLGLKAVAMAEGVAETVATEGEHGEAAAAPAAATDAAPAANSCAPASLAEMAGLIQFQA